MSNEVQRILCSPALVAVRERQFERLRGVFSRRPQGDTFFLWGEVGRAVNASPYDAPEEWVAEALERLAGRTDRLRDENVFRPLCIEAGLYGVHFIDRMFGADVFELSPGNWQCHTLETPIGSLEPVDLETDETWAQERRIVQAFIDSGVTVPVYGLPTLSSAQNIALNLYGQELLIGMITEPEAVHHDLRVINELICDLHRWYVANLPAGQLQPVVSWARTQPPGFGQLCGCSCHLLSSAHYAEFIAPHDAELLSVYPHGGMIHLCGVHTQHIGTWRRMHSLRAVQLNDRAAEDLEIYFNGLRDDQILYPIPCDGMPLEQILDITGGQRVVIPADYSAPVPGRAAGQSHRKTSAGPAPVIRHEDDKRRRPAPDPHARTNWEEKP